MNATLVLPTEEVTSLQIGTPTTLSLRSATSWALTDPAVTQVFINSIIVTPNGDGQMTDLDGLVASIRKRGVLQPIIVAPDGRLLAGRRRLEAARRAGMTTVPVRVCEIETERAAIEIGLIENVERADLDPLTRAKAYRALIEQGAMVEEIANLVGQGIGHVYQHLQLLDLHPEVQHALHTRALSFADARALKPLEWGDQAMLLREIHSAPKPLSSRQVKLRVDARRVMRLVRKEEPVRPNHGQTQEDDSRAADSETSEVEGNYAALFETEEAAISPSLSSQAVDPLDQLNTLIAAMVVAAEGEDQVRAWARQLSHILAALQLRANANDGDAKKKPLAVQERLL